MYQSMLFKLLRHVTFIWSNIRGGEGKGAVAGWGPQGLVWASHPGGGWGGFPGHPGTGSPVGRLILGGHRGEGPSGGAAVCSSSEPLAKV